MDNNIILIVIICLVIISFLIFAGIMVKLFYDYLKVLKLSQDNNENIIQMQYPVNIRPSEVTAINPIIVPPAITDPVKEFDYHKLNDPLETPTTRVDRYLLGPLELRSMFNQPVRGYPDNPRWLGILISDDDHSECQDGKCSMDKDNRILKLFGRQQFPGSNQYDYYTMLNMGNDQVKIRIHHKKELYDDDDINIHELKRRYKVKLNKNDDLIYNPYF